MAAKRESGFSEKRSAIERRAAIAAETLQILRDGWYSVDGTDVDISAAVQQSVARSILLPAESRHHLTLPRPLHSTTTTDVVNMGTLDASLRLIDAGFGSVAALNFASAKNPGGGFDRGADAQEENLARNSALYAALTVHADHYAQAKHENDPLYSHTVIYSPAVPVLRSEAGELLSQPWKVAFITAAAPNASMARKGSVSEELIARVLQERADRVLGTAATRGHDGLVLGAWGCGVFGNAPVTVARAFAGLLSGKYARQFRHVTFAVLGPAENCEAFAAVFRGQLPAIGGDADANRAAHYCHVDLVRWEDLGRRAGEAVRAKRWVEAEGLMRECVALRPGWHKSYIFLAGVLTKLEEGQKALEVLSQGLRVCTGEQAQQELEAAREKYGGT